MVDEQQPAKKVVKRVVKKTVTRPAPAQPAKTVRYGRPVARRARPQAKVASRPGGRSGDGPTKTATKTARPRVEVGAKVGAAGKALSSRGSNAASGLAGAAGSVARATGTFVAGRARGVLAWRIPHLKPRPAAVLTGLIVGLVSVGLGLIALEIFSNVRGVSSGGGRWGSLTFVMVAFVAILLGDLLLTAFGTAHAGLISFLGVVLTIVAILALFLELADSRWALVLVPALGAVTYLVSQWLIALAESTPIVPE